LDNHKFTKFIIGLGNPGFRYKKTMHNAGFLAVDYIQKNIGGFSKWKNNKKLLAEISENPEQNMILAKPQTYMNKSGETAKLLLTDYRLPTTVLFVIHDDFDIPIGEFKLEKNRGAGGHHGVQSIIDALGTNKFWRLRIGIKPKNMQSLIKADLSAGIRQLAEKAEDFVLKKFTREERKIIEKIIPEAARQLLEMISDLR
jgi:PTH1 family peptidyl-tRNA hydrolase